MSNSKSFFWKLIAPTYEKEKAEIIYSRIFNLISRINNISQEFQGLYKVINSSIYSVKDDKGYDNKLEFEIIVNPVLDKSKFEELFYSIFDNNINPYLVPYLTSGEFDSRILMKRKILSKLEETSLDCRRDNSEEDKNTENFDNSLEDFSITREQILKAIKKPIKNRHQRGTIFSKGIASYEIKELPAKPWIPPKHRRCLSE